ncbi:MAG: hypothetical protein RL220_160, partial [Bacteroidota bacterium]
MKKALLALLIFVPGICFGQTPSADSAMIASIFSEVLVNGECYENLRELCKDVGHRLAGSENADKAIAWGQDKLEGYGFDRVFLMP